MSASNDDDIQRCVLRFIKGLKQNRGGVIFMAFFTYAVGSKRD